MPAPVGRGMTFVDVRPSHLTSVRIRSNKLNFRTGAVLTSVLTRRSYGGPSGFYRLSAAAGRRSNDNFI